MDHPDQPSQPILGIQPKQGLSNQSDPAKPINQTNPESLKRVQSVIGIFWSIFSFTEKIYKILNCLRPSLKNTSRLLMKKMRANGLIFII